MPKFEAESTEIFFAMFDTMIKEPFNPLATDLALQTALADKYRPDIIAGSTEYGLIEFW